MAREQTKHGQTTWSTPGVGRPSPRSEEGPDTAGPGHEERPDTAGPGHEVQRSGTAATDSGRAPSGERPVRYEGAGVTAGFIVLLVAAATVVIVVAQNSERVPFEFLWWQADIPLAVLMLATALLVIVVDALVGVIWRRRRRRVRELSARTPDRKR